MGPSLEQRIQAALEDAKNEPKSREMALVITKLEEALMWLSKTA